MPMVRKPGEVDLKLRVPRIVSAREGKCPFAIGSLLLFGILALISILVFKGGDRDDHHIQYPVVHTASAAKVLLTDRVKPKNDGRGKVAEVFKDLFVDNMTGADCSFIAAFMLMVNHDPDYPYKIMTAMDGGMYRIEFPGYDDYETVTPADIDTFMANAVEPKLRWKTVIKNHHVPLGIDILRCAYYDVQRRVGERPPQYRVYGGGYPVSDLMVLTGVREGGVIVADVPEGSFSNNVATFANSRAKRLKYVLKDGKTVRISSEDAGETNSPLRSFEKLQDYMIIVGSASNFGIVHGLFGKTIPNHAYYLLGITKNMEYVLGNPYQTRKAVVINEEEFMEEFSSVHYVKMR